MLLAVEEMEKKGQELGKKEVKELKRAMILRKQQSDSEENAFSNSSWTTSVGQGLMRVFVKVYDIGNLPLVSLSKRTGFTEWILV